MDADWIGDLSFAGESSFTGANDDGAHDDDDDVCRLLELSRRVLGPKLTLSQARAFTFDTSQNKIV